MVQKIKLTDTQTRKKLAATFGVSMPYVSMALDFKRDSDTARKIRRAALNSGGVLLKEAN